MSISTNMFGFDFSFGLISSKRGRANSKKSNEPVTESYKYTSKWRTKPQIVVDPVIDTYYPRQDSTIQRDFTCSTTLDRKHSLSYLTVDDFPLRTEPKRILFAGDSYSGKSSLMDRVEQKFRLTEKQRSIKHSEKYGVSYSKLTSSTQNLLLMDIESATGYTHLHPGFSSSINLFVICFDLSRDAGLENAYLEWIKHINEAYTDIPFIVVGCKSDATTSTNSRQVMINAVPRGRKSCKLETFENACMDWGALSYIESSSWTLANIDSVYDAIIDKPSDAKISPSPMKRKNTIKSRNSSFRFSIRRKNNTQL